MNIASNQAASLTHGFSLVANSIEDDGYDIASSSTLCSSAPGTASLAWAAVVRLMMPFGLMALTWQCLTAIRM